MATYAFPCRTGRYLPEIEVTNDELRKRFDSCCPSSSTRWSRPPASAADGMRPEGATSDVALPRPGRRSNAQGSRRGRGPDPARHRFARLHHPGDLSRPSAQARRDERGNLRRRLRVRFIPDRPRVAAGIMATNPAIRTVLVVGVYLMHKLADPDDPMGSSTATARAPRCSSPPSSPGSRRGLPGRRRVSQLLGHLLGRHARAGHARYP